MNYILYHIKYKIYIEQLYIEYDVHNLKKLIKQLNYFYGFIAGIFNPMFYLF